MERGDIYNGAWYIGTDSNGDKWCTQCIDRFGMLCDEFDRLGGDAEAFKTFVIGSQDIIE